MKPSANTAPSISEERVYCLHAGYFWIDENRKKVQVIDVIYIKRDQQRQLMNMPLEDE